MRGMEGGRMAEWERGKRVRVSCLCSGIRRERAKMLGRKGGSSYSVAVPSRHGWRERASETFNRESAKGLGQGMKRAVEETKDKRRV